jgi:hypothetical protein
VADSRLGGRHALHASHLAWNADGVSPFSVSTEPPPLFVSLVRPHPIR